ncbi:MAG: putative collagen-binding domain-containing protein [Bacteroidia bacterium]
MQSADEKVSEKRNYVFAKAGEVYAVYLTEGGTANLDLGDQRGTFSVQWYDPRNGGELQAGSLREVSGGSMVSLGEAPAESGQDWVVLLRVLK